MRRRLFHRVLTLYAVAMLVAGCATTPSTTAPLVRYDPDKPQIRLAGANVEYAKSVAMGSAVTKGWTIVDSSGNRLVLQRPLTGAPDPTSAVTQAPGSLPPVVEVESGFFERPGGVDVVLSAEVITNRGTKDEKRQDFTETYRDDLMRSLASLQAAWAATGARVAAATPPLQSAQDLGAPPTAEETQEIARTEGSGQWGPTKWTSAPSPAAQPTPPSAGAATVAEESNAPITSSPAQVEERGQADSMLVLSTPVDTGVWAYYAEHYAKAHGCILTGAGATLVRKQPEYEVHSVGCKSGQTLLLRCNAGTCEEMH